VSLPLPPVLASFSGEEDAELESAETPTLPIRALEAAAGIVSHAASLQARVQEQMHAVDRRLQRPMATPVPKRATRSAAAGAMIRHLRSPASARDAWVAAMIFAPPRCLD